jgi:alkanesulfonate monooxygenase SsuD/methylene tetrahydromethanopterin reductase-like flavin-dependent oxidoreductase (luciferase family)
MSQGELSRRVAAIGQEPERLRTNGLYGTPSEIVDRIASYAALGVSRIYVQLLDVTDLEHIALIGDAIAPLVSGL